MIAELFFFRDYGKKLCIISDKPGRVAIVCKATFSPDIDTTPPDLEFKYEGSYEVTGGGGRVLIPIFT